MAELLQELSELNAFSIFVRVILASITGAIVGIEREYHGRAAGLRTHMLVSLGAALTAMIGLYMSVEMRELGINSDVQRTGAQVISGVGFLGAGTILLKKGNSRITGLTTAAGLWATAAVGLAVGYGMYEAAIITAVVITLAFTAIGRIEHLMSGKRQRVFVYIEIDGVNSVKETVKHLKTEYAALEIQVTAARSGSPANVGMEALIRLPAKKVSDQIEKLETVPHVLFALQIV